MNPGVQKSRVGTRGFTLTELLVVIAVIAILAGLLFPVLKSARDNARKGQCSTNIHTIIQAMQMYKDDWRVYPDALFGFEATAVSGTCPSGNPDQPGNPRLFPEYVKDKKVFNCPNSPTKTDGTATVDAVNRTTGLQHVNDLRSPVFKYCYYTWDSYDFQYMPYDPTRVNNGTAQRQLHYALKWTDGRTYSGTTEPQPQGRRQLIYRNPPDSTVVTWCRYHAPMDDPTRATPDGINLVGFLSGRVQEIPTSRLGAWSATTGNWSTDPKP